MYTNEYLNFHSNDVMFQPSYPTRQMKPGMFYPFHIEVASLSSLSEDIWLEEPSDIYYMLCQF